MARERIAAPEHPRRDRVRQLEGQRARLDALDNALGRWGTLTQAQRVDVVEAVGHVVVRLARVMLDLAERGDLDVRRGR